MPATRAWPRIFRPANTCYGGWAHPWHGWRILRFDDCDDCDDFLVANANPQPGTSPRGKWNALVLPTHYSKWSLLEDTGAGRPAVRIPGNGQFVLYRRCGESHR